MAGRRKSRVEADPSGDDLQGQLAEDRKLFRAYRRVAGQYQASGHTDHAEYRKIAAWLARHKEEVE